MAGGQHDSHDKGHGHGHGHHAKPVREGTKETDEELPYKIRPIELIKHNPNVFWANPYNFGNTFEILGGYMWLGTAVLGSLLAHRFYANKIANSRTTYFNAITVGGSRLVFGFLLGGWVGYMRFGDRQRVHNAYVADRLYRRYPESKNITTTELWKYKFAKAEQEFYRWS